MEIVDAVTFLLKRVARETYDGAEKTLAERHIARMEALNVEYTAPAPEHRAPLADAVSTVSISAPAPPLSNPTMFQGRASIAAPQASVVK